MSAAIFITGASVLMALVVLGLWRKSKERFLLLAGSAQLLFAVHQAPLFLHPSNLADWAWQAGMTALFALYLGLSSMVINLLKNPPSRVWLRLNKWYLWGCVPLVVLVFVCSAYLGITQEGFVQHELRGITVLAMLFNIGLAIVVVKKYYWLQSQLLQSRLETQMQQERATLLERQRIMSDIHDTVGSQLVGVLSLIRSHAPYAELEVQTAQTLLELRMAIDAIQPVNGNLAVVLATLRHRLQPRLDGQGMALIWQVDDLPRLADLSPHVITHIQRIVLEAFSNAMVHSGASQVVFKALHDSASGVIEMSIADNGKGCPGVTQLPCEAQGQGLRSMRARALAIGAQLELVSKPNQGLQVHLSLATSVHSNF